MSCGTDFVDLFRRRAVLVDKILEGARPADLPVKEPTAFELVIDTRTARALGLTIAPVVLGRVDAVLQ